MDYLDRLAQSTIERISRGYYTGVTSVSLAPRRSFIEAIRSAQAEGRNAVIAEIKPASPSAGVLRAEPNIRELAKGFQMAGATGLSVLTEPTHFHGSLQNLKLASELGLPTLMKDFTLDPVQLDACIQWGGSAILLILSLFNRGYCRLTPEAMIAQAHQRDLEVLLEVSSVEEFKEAQRTPADMIGINNRDLATLQMDLSRTGKILSLAKKDRIVWALSGIETVDDLRELQAAGADAFLVGTSLMRAADPSTKLRELIAA
jgi:indole-3-glycerol phosphate synthase